MSIQYQILGKPGRDNSLILKVDSGNKLYRILIDCGENTIAKISQSDVKAADILLLSHLHLDHIAGFDYFFRRTFDRNLNPVHIFGPEDTSSIMHNRFLGFKWNLTDGLSGGYYVHDIFAKHKEIYWYEAGSGFSQKIFIRKENYSNIILKNNHLKISSALLNHRIPSIGYTIKEADSINISKEEIFRLSFVPGPWLNKIKDLSLSGDELISLNEKSYTISSLREKLLNTTPGASVTYLTDFIFDSASQSAAVELARDTDILVCESQYLSEDESLAAQNYHLTAAQAAKIALAAKVKKLILFHVSERYIHNENKMKDMLTEARNIFPETYFPEHWQRSELQ